MDANNPPAEAKRLKKNVVAHLIDICDTKPVVAVWKATLAKEGGDAGSVTDAASA